jgi:hypothetical protein
MDISKFKTSDWLIIAGGLAMLIFGLFLDWASVDTGFGSASGNNAFDYFFTGGIAWLLLVAAGVVAFLLAAGVMKAGTTPWPLVLLGATALAFLLMLLRIILGGGEESGIDLDRAAGMWLAFLASIVALVGAVLKYKESGGDLNDLKDFNKIKGAFDRPGDSTPPPPPPPTV